MSKAFNILRRVRFKVAAAVALAAPLTCFAISISFLANGVSFGDTLAFFLIFGTLSLVFSAPYMILRIGESFLKPASEIETKDQERRRRKHFPQISKHNFAYYLKAEKLVKEINSSSAEGVTVVTALSFAEDTLVYLQTSLEELSSGSYDPDSRAVKEKIAEVRNSISSLMDVRDQMSELKLTSGYRPGPPSKNEVFKEINLLKSSFKETDSGLLN